MWGHRQEGDQGDCSVCRRQHSLTEAVIDECGHNGKQDRSEERRTWQREFWSPEDGLNATQALVLGRRILHQREMRVRRGSEDTIAGMKPSSHTHHLCEHSLQFRIVRYSGAALDEPRNCIRKIKGVRHRS
jgi:hypothetical protein